MNPAHCNIGRILLVTKLQLGNELFLEALLRERGSGTGIESQSAPAKRGLKDIGVAKPARPPTDLHDSLRRLGAW